MSYFIKNGQCVFRCSIYVIEKINIILDTKCIARFKSS